MDSFDESKSLPQGQGTDGAMKSAKRWLLWKEEPKPGSKPRKVPYYVDGVKRNGTLDTPADVARLATYEEAQAALESSPSAAGLGFALGQDGGGYWQGIDLDDVGQGDPLLETLPGYVERSPSNKGVHAIGYGRSFGTYGSNGSGTEAYCKTRFFTYTGRVKRNLELTCLADFVEERIAPLHNGKSHHLNSEISTSVDSEICEVLDAQTLSDLQAALNSMDSDDYDLWIDVGLDLYSLGEVGKSLWLTWSQKSSEWKPGNEKKWDTFSNSHSNYRNVFSRAQKLGWENPNSNEARGKVTFNFPIPETDQFPENGEWAVPELMSKHIDRTPFPLEALPLEIRESIEEVTHYLQCPVALAVQSALGALSAAVQGLMDVKRDDSLCGPTSLFFIAMALSGERKSECSKHFMGPLEERERELQEEDAEKMRQYQADIAAWKAVNEMLLEAIKSDAKAKQPIDDLKAKLKEHEDNKPKEPIDTRILMEDETQENLVKDFAKGYPSKAIISSEGGTVLGGHAFKAEIALRMMAFWNKLWSGESYSKGRVGEGFNRVDNVRLTICLQIQEQIFRNFLGDNKNVARAIGLCARFLISSPESNIGHRFYRKPPDWSKVKKFNARIKDILRNPFPVDKITGTLTPTEYQFSEEGTNFWIEFIDAIERRLQDTGDLAEVRDVASKIGENAARLAGQLAYYEWENELMVSRRINLKYVKAGCAIAYWYLMESLRFFGRLQLSKEIENAEKLEKYLIGHCKKEKCRDINKRYALHFGPIRDSKEFTQAINVLREAKRVVVVNAKMRSKQNSPYIYLNPALMN